jgi:hypothetical protein
MRNFKNFTHSKNIIRQIKLRRVRLAGHVARMGEDRKVYKVLFGNPKRKRPLARRRSRWEYGTTRDEPSFSGATKLVS